MYAIKIIYDCVVLMLAQSEPACRDGTSGHAEAEDVDEVLASKDGGLE